MNTTIKTGKRGRPASANPKVIKIKDTNAPKVTWERKGRPSGTTKQIVIEDVMIEPYYIAVDENQFTLNKRDKNGDKAIGFYSSLDAAVFKVIRLNALTAPTTTTLKSFVSTYNDCFVSMSTLIKSKFGDASKI